MGSLKKLETKVITRKYLLKLDFLLIFILGLVKDIEQKAFIIKLDTYLKSSTHLLYLLQIGFKKY